MTDPESRIGMPGDLAAAISRLDPSNRRAALNGWDRISTVSQQKHAHAINRGYFSFARRFSCRLAIRQLIKAGQEL